MPDTGMGGDVSAGVVGEDVCAVAGEDIGEDVCAVAGEGIGEFCCAQALHEIKTAMTAMFSKESF
jgi:hypothetical protein